jgi:hypothetical protein
MEPGSDMNTCWSARAEPAIGLAKQYEMLWKSIPRGQKGAVVAVWRSEEARFCTVGLHRFLAIPVPSGSLEAVLEVGIAVFIYKTSTPMCLDKGYDIPSVGRIGESTAL